jgi:hypothetical protein
VCHRDGFDAAGAHFHGLNKHLAHRFAGQMAAVSREEGKDVTITAAAFPHG